MRLFLLLALTVVLAYGIWTLLGVEDDPLPAPPSEGGARPARPAPGARPIPTTVTLVLRVRTKASTIPQGTLAGYRWGGDDRLRAVDPKTGRVRFTDAPAGKLTLLARAPGYEELEQARYLTAGVPQDAILTLEPRKQP